MQRQVCLSMQMTRSKLEFTKIRDKSHSKCFAYWAGITLCMVLEEPKRQIANLVAVD